MKSFFGLKEKAGGAVRVLSEATVFFVVLLGALQPTSWLTLCCPSRTFEPLLEVLPGSLASVQGNLRPTRQFSL